MRITATLLLVAMAATFIVTRQLGGVHPAWGYVAAFAEAAMVGGLADWFAVTALFRHPLGLPIPHTAIIPENKDRIADTMAGFLRDNFLTAHVVARRLKDMNLARAAGEFLIQPRNGGQGRIASGAGNLLADLLESMDPDRLGSQLRGGLAKQAERLELSPLLGSVLSAAIADGRHRPLLDSLVRWAGLTVEANEELIRDMIQKRANAILRWTGLDDRLASSVLDGLYRLLAEVLVDPQHPLRGKVEEGLQKLADDLQHDPALRARVEQAKRDVLANPAVAEWWQGVWERLRTGMIATARDPQSSLGGMLSEAMADLGRALQQDQALQWQVNRFARRSLVGVASRYGGQIVRLVSDTVKRWDARTVTGRIESAVGRDLQFIRINGTLVGGLVGLTIHALSHWL